MTGWRVCMDYRKLNKAIMKDHFPLIFNDQMLDRLVGKEFYYFLDGYSAYNQIAIAPSDQERLPLHALMALLPLEGCFAMHLVIKRSEKTNLVLNWEKCHFMVQEGIVLGYKILNRVLEVDKAKIERIEKLPPPTSVKGFRRFLGHGRFYKMFIKDFSKISNLCAIC
ncbi:Retrotransposon gag protein, putative [Theobroma cacao]|uniref:Retrotransposon gag protein, putative n=1 Tax=Theobroma cacao TaxID=3641 RepID=A0A061GSQ3_THECC|nr:Retrotransposon gag protein, putative [Theobroma cacao]